MLTGASPLRSPHAPRLGAGTRRRAPGGCHPMGGCHPTSGCYPTGGCLAQPFLHAGAAQRDGPPAHLPARPELAEGRSATSLRPGWNHPSGGSGATTAEVAGTAEHPSPGPGYRCCQTAGCYQVLQWECCRCHGSRFIFASCHHSTSPSKPGASSLPRRVLPSPRPRAPR